MTTLNRCVRKQLHLLFLLIATLPLAVFAQEPGCEKLKLAKEATYGFRPSQLTKEQQNEKAKLMDEFWADAKALLPGSVSCLGAMLQAETNDPFFSFDGAALLVGLDKSPKSLHLAAASAARTDLADLDPAGYISLALQLARGNVDIVLLAEKYLRHPKVDTYLPMHGGMKLERVSGAILLYGSMDPALADRNLVAAVNLPEPEARAVAIFMLAHSLTEASFAALQEQNDLSTLPVQGQQAVASIRKYSHVVPSSSPKFSREKVLARLRMIVETGWITNRENYQAKMDPDNPPYVAEVPEFYDSAIATLTPEDLPLLREARRKSVRGVSDESLYEYFAVSRLILGVINRYDLYKEYRIH